MEQAFFAGQKPGRSKGASPWMAFYLASSLGLMLNALSVGYAEPTGTIATPAGESTVEAAPVPSSVEAVPATIPMKDAIKTTHELGQVTLPGIQNAVLTVGKEIQTKGKIINLTGRSSTAKAENTHPASKPPASSGYYLQLPEPKTTQHPAPATPASSIPIASVTQMAPQSETALNTLSTVDPEAQPLESSQGSDAPMNQSATQMMLRITLSLMAVLGLLLAFSRFVVPRVMARYPEFFDNLKQKNQPQALPLDIPKTVAEKLAEKNIPLGFSLFKPKTTPEPVKNRLENIEMNGSHFTVLSSTALGKDKDLHLVEILGRQLVVATTPYTVSLIQDLSQPQTANPALEEAALASPSPNQLADSHSDVPTRDSLEAGPLHFLDIFSEVDSQAENPISETDTQETVEASAEIPSALSMDDSLLDLVEQIEALDIESEIADQDDEPIEIVADLDDHPPQLETLDPQQAEFIRPKDNLYANKPIEFEPRLTSGNQAQLNIEALEPEPLPEAIVWQDELPESPELVPQAAMITPIMADESVYLKYLTPTANKRSGATSGGVSHPDDIIVLNDYDDVYGY